MGCAVIQEMCDGFGECLVTRGLVYGKFVEGNCHGHINGSSIIWEVTNHSLNSGVFFWS